jgi:hypothetical protein
MRVGGQLRDTFYKEHILKMLNTPPCLPISITIVGEVAYGLHCPWDARGGLSRNEKNEINYKNCPWDARGGQGRSTA